MNIYVAIDTLIENTDFFKYHHRYQTSIDYHFGVLRPKYVKVIPKGSRYVVEFYVDDDGNPYLFDMNLEKSKKKDTVNGYYGTYIDKIKN